MIFNRSKDKTIKQFGVVERFKNRIYDYWRYVMPRRSTGLEETPRRAHWSLWRTEAVLRAICRPREQIADRLIPLTWPLNQRLALLYLREGAPQPSRRDDRIASVASIAAVGINPDEWCKMLAPHIGTSEAAVPFHLKVERKLRRLASATSSSPTPMI
jgi:hypothetical protein